MLVPEFFFRCTVFLCQEDGNQHRPKGTAFLLSTPIGRSADDFTDVIYAVTAAHNIQFARFSGGRTFLRLKRKDGSINDIETPTDTWVESDDNDLALARLRINLSEYDHERL